MTDEEPPNQTIDLLSDEMNEEVELTLTKGQALFIYKMLESNIQPRGFQMVQFAFDMMNRFEDTVNAIESELLSEFQQPTVEVTKTVENELPTTIPTEEISPQSDVFSGVGNE